MKRRVEVSTTGLDEVLQGLSSDPFAPQGFPVGTGLRIPTALAGISQVNQPRYWFMLASRRFAKRKSSIKIVGLRQILTIGVDANNGTPPFRPVEMLVTTSSFKFVDGNVSWHLAKIPSGDNVSVRPQTDTQNWAFRDSDGPAMLYETFTNTATNPQTGAPLYYVNGLTAYTPPTVGADRWELVAGLGNMHEIRFPWTGPNSFDQLDIELEGSGRIALFATVLQTNPATRTAGANTVSALSSTASPEEAFIKDLTIAGPPANGPTFWRIGGSLIFEDEIAAGGSDDG